MAEINPASCHRCAQAVPWVSLWGNLGLAIYKLLVGMLGRSSALVADALHSFADVIGSTGILIATKSSARAPDERFPFGRGKAEFIGAVFVYTVLLFFGGGIIISALRKILNPALEAPHVVTLLGAVVSVLYNFVMYKYATCVGRRNHSPAILADAFENRADAISSVACIAGIFGAMYIHPAADPLAAIAVGLIIIWNCQEQLREATSGLMDGGLNESDCELVRRAVLARPGVLAISFLRTRQTGARYWIDLGIEVAPDLPVEAADRIAQATRDAVKGYPKCHHVEVYVSPPQDEHEGDFAVHGATPRGHQEEARP
jgi:cation diffusion facilitator family transporter